MMHVSFFLLCLTSHDLVKLKIFPFGSRWLSLGDYAFSRSSWTVEHVGVDGSDWASGICLEISGWAIWDRMGAGRGFLGNVIPPLLLFFFLTFDFPRIDTTHQPFLDRQMPPFGARVRERENHGFTAPSIYPALEEALRLSRMKTKKKTKRKRR